MTSQPLSHPLDRLSRADRRRWRRLDAGARAELDGQQLRRLRRLAEERVTVDSVHGLEASVAGVAVVELGISGWRLVGRVTAWAGSLLETAVATGSVRLTAAGRYGPYWTLSFAGEEAPLTLLVSQLIVSGADGGAGRDVGWPDVQRVG
jgi:hypothetical protein